MGKEFDALKDGLIKYRRALMPNVKDLTGEEFIHRYRQTLRVSNPRVGWGDWVASGASRDGYGMEGRFKGWGFNSPFPAVPFVFLDYQERVIPNVLAVLVSTPKDGKATFVTINHSNEVSIATRQLRSAVPVFINKLGGSQSIARDVATMCTVTQAAYNKRIVNSESRDDLKDGLGHNPWETGDVWVAVNPGIQATKTTTSNLKENDTMKNTKADNFIQDQKAIAKEIASLNAGRVSNKVVKEAMRPLVALLFKPTFMQKIAMKVTGAKNPLDEFMNTPYADFVCAQLFKVVIDMRGIENEHVKKTANSAVIYAGLKVTDELPVEDLIDAAIKQVTDATVKAVGKGE